MDSSTSSESPLETSNPNKGDEKVKTQGKSYTLALGIARDMVPVIVGILVALFINKMQQNYQDERLLKSTLNSLSQEFEKNSENIRIYLPRQEQFLDTLNYYERDTTYSILDITQKTGNMGSPEIYATNWQISMNNNGMRLLNFETINLLSQIDSKHQELKDQERFLYSIVYGPPMFSIGNEGLVYRKGMAFWLQSYIGNVKELLELYSQFQSTVQKDEFH